MPPVGEDGAGELHPPSGAAAIINRKDHVIVRSKKLALELRGIARECQGVIVLTVRTAMNPHDRRIAAADLIARRLDDLSMDLGAVATWEADVLDRPESELREQRVVVVAQPPRPPVFERKHLERRAIVADQSRRMPGGGGDLRDNQRIGEARDGAAREGDARGILQSVVLDRELDRTAVGGELRRDDCTIESAGELAHSPRGQLRYREDVGYVGVVLRLIADEKSEQSPVGTPFEMLMVRRPRRQQRARLRAGGRIDEVDLVAAGGARLLHAVVVADEGNLPTVRGENRRRVGALLVAGQWGARAAPGVEQVEMSA